MSQKATPRVNKKFTIFLQRSDNSNRTSSDIDSHGHLPQPLWVLAASNQGRGARRESAWSAFYFRHHALIHHIESTCRWGRNLCRRTLDICRDVFGRLFV